MWTRNEPLLRAPARQRREAGSAYVAVLLVLVVLTILALALSLITQTEVQIGSNERTVNRVFFAADAGTQAALANLLLADDTNPHTYLLTDTGLQLIDDKLQFGTQVATSQFSLVNFGPCDFCEIGDEGYGNLDYKKVTFAVTSTASRYATITAAGTDKTPLAQATVDVMFEVQPRKPEIIDPEKAKK